jgi:putative FmdB family regulatory protein
VIALPTYGYQCKDCKHEFSVFQSMKDDAISVCPECEGSVKRLLYPVGIVFKGSGWYINDSRKPDPSESTGSSAVDPKSDSKASESKSGDSSDSSKPESKSESKSESTTSAKSGSTSESGAKTNSGAGA